MVIKFSKEVQRAFHKALKTNQEVGRLLRYLANPMSVAGYALAAWRVGADLNWTGEFFIEAGLLSHWQVWLAIAIAIQFGGAYLARLSADPSGNLNDRAVA
jgi:hypothetical protein